MSDGILKTEIQTNCIIIIYTGNQWQEMQGNLKVKFLISKFRIFITES